MEKRKKTYFDHALDRALGKARCLVEDLKFIRDLHREDRDEVAYSYAASSDDDLLRFCIFRLIYECCRGIDCFEMFLEALSKSVKVIRFLP